MTRFPFAFIVTVAMLGVACGEPTDPDRSKIAQVAVALRVEPDSVDVPWGVYKRT